MTDSFPLDEAQSELINTTVFGYSRRRITKAESEQRLFAHYTSAEAALSIISQGEVWLRNASVMNDYSEVAHGEACLRHVLIDNTETRQKSASVLGQLQAGLHEWLVEQFDDQWARTRRRVHTYLVSISEHGPAYIGPGTVVGETEEQFGRLSMWRAYGSSGGVALIFNRERLFTENNSLNAFISPVFYGMPQEFAIEWDRMLSGVAREIVKLQQLPPEVLREALGLLITSSSFTCKHPAFAEEREWRVTYSADVAKESVNDVEFNAASPIQREIRAINGVPQRLYKIPLKDAPEKGVSGISLPDLLHSIIIGPTQYPTAVYDAMLLALARAGVPDPGSRIQLSRIPIRT